jgi:hypothetical protein
MIVVVLGGLTAVALLGVSSLTDSTKTIGTITAPGTTLRTGSPGHPVTGNPGIGGIGVTTSCTASADAARAASGVYYATSGGTYPTRWSDLTPADAPMLVLPKDVVATSPVQLSGRGWKLVISGGGTVEPTFTCTGLDPLPSKPSAAAGTLGG